MKKKLLVITLMFCCLFILLPGISLAANSGTCGENVTWSLENGTLTLQGSGAITAYEKDSDVPWHSLRSQIKNVVVDEGITYIGNYLFYNCSNLTQINLPASLTEVGEGTFAVSASLSNIVLADGNKMFSLEDGVLFSKDKTTLICYPAGKTGTTYTVPDGVTSIEYEAFAGCKNLNNIILPDSMETIGIYAFVFCSNLTSINIPDNVNKIGYGAFFDCENLLSITIPDKVTILETGLFFECSKLSNVQLSNNIAKIEQNVFERCKSLESVSIPKSVTCIESMVFWDCNKLTDIYYEGSKDEWLAIEGAADITSADGESIIIEYYSSNKTTKATIHYAGGMGAGGEVTPDPGTTQGGTSGNCGYYGSNAKWSLKDGTLTISGSGMMKNYDVITNFAPWFMGSVNDIKIEDGITTIGSASFGWLFQLRTIIIPDTVFYIGSDAFNNSRLISDIYYAGSEEQWNQILIQSGNYTLDNATIHYNSTGPDDIPEPPEEDDGFNVYYGGNKSEHFVYDLEYYLSQTASTTYNPTLAHILIALSWAAYDENNIKQSFESLGFDSSDIFCKYDNADEPDSVAYAFSKKTLSNGQDLVVVSICGSRGSIENWDPDWKSNLNLGKSLFVPAWHSGFEIAMNKVYADLDNFVDDFSNTIFVVTGHSRGAAVANLLEVKLSDIRVAKSKVYGYNFACPDVAFGLGTGWNWLGDHNNMFNIANSSDPVSVIPGVLMTDLAPNLKGFSWGKFGQSRWFAENWSLTEEIVLNIDLDNNENVIPTHDPKVYLSYLSNEPNFNEFKTWEARNLIIPINTMSNEIGKLFKVFCPVDVTIVDSNGKPLASVIGDQVNYYDSNFGKVIILQAEDKKAIYVNGNEALNLHLVATDGGTMDYSVATINLNTGEVLSEKSFNNVELYEGKQMTSLANVEEITGVGIDVSKVPLYVLDDNGESEKIVLPDDKGTEVNLDSVYTITFDTDGGTLVNGKNTDYVISGQTYKMSNATKSGYTLKHWAIGTKESTITAKVNDVYEFTADTTVYAIWNRNGSSSGSSGSGNRKPTNTNENPETIKPDTTKPENTNKPGNTNKPSSTVTELNINNVFADVQNNVWYSKAIAYVYNQGLMKGVEQNLFAPNENTTRGQIVTILYRLHGEPDVTNMSAFSDVGSGQYYAKAVAWAATNGIVNGYSATQFAPDDKVTREQLAAILYRYAKFKSEDVSVKGNLKAFSDSSSVATWAEEAMQWAVGASIINGDNGALNPAGNATRAEVATMIMRMLEK